jgi:hypothetical protein
MREYHQIMDQQRTRELWAVVLSIIVLSLCVGGVLAAYVAFGPRQEAAPTPPAMTVAPTAVTPPQAVSTTVPLPSPTSTSIPTERPLPTDTPVILPSPYPTPPSDLQDDVTIYDTGDPAGETPAGVDIRAANVGADLRVVLQPPNAEIPVELIEWAAEDEVLLWLSLYGPIPDPPPAFTDWVFVLDLDGDETTGRPVGAVRVNPDLGYEAAVGISYDGVSGEYEPYFLVWDSARSTLVTVSDAPRFILNEARTLIGLALRLETLEEAVERITGVTLAPGAVKGRVAAQSIVGGRKVIDVYPELPD